MKYTLQTGDAISISKIHRPQSVHSIICSPPYFGLRDYGHDPTEWPDGTMACLGQEDTPERYVQHMVDIFRALRRILHDEGTVWLNIGDSYYKGKKHHQLKSGDICMIPHRVALALQADGWIVRQDIVWHKPNAMPESVKDRPTLAHEYIFLIAKQKGYYYDSWAIKEPWKTTSDFDLKRAMFGHKEYDGKMADAKEEGRKQEGRFGESKVAGDPRNGRNKRSVWSATRQNYAGAHFAVYPTWLIEPCVKAGTSERGACPSCGKQWRRVEKSDTDWEPGCKCGEKPIPSVILDPFSGSATTGYVALKNGRDYLGFDTQPDYNEIGKKRLEELLDELRHKAPSLDGFFSGAV